MDTFNIYNELNQGIKSILKTHLIETSISEKLSMEILFDCFDFTTFFLSPLYTYGKTCRLVSDLAIPVGTDVYRVTENSFMKSVKTLKSTISDSSSNSSFMLNPLSLENFFYFHSYSEKKDKDSDSFTFYIQWNFIPLMVPFIRRINKLKPLLKNKDILNIRKDYKDFHDNIYDFIRTGCLIHENINSQKNRISKNSEFTFQMQLKENVFYYYQKYLYDKTFYFPFISEIYGQLSSLLNIIHKDGSIELKILYTLFPILSHIPNIESPTLNQEVVKSIFLLLSERLSAPLNPKDILATFNDLKSEIVSYIHKFNCCYECIQNFSNTFWGNFPSEIVVKPDYPYKIILKESESSYVSVQKSTVEIINELFKDKKIPQSIPNFIIQNKLIGLTTENRICNLLRCPQPLPSPIPLLFGDIKYTNFHN